MIIVGYVTCFTFHFVNRFATDHSEVVRPRIGRLLGEGLGWVEGEAEHRRMCQLVNPALS